MAFFPIHKGKASLIVIALVVFSALFYVAFIRTAKSIPKAVIFGNPVKAAPEISPDGRLIAYAAPLNGVLNIFIQPLDSTNNPLTGPGEPITADTNRGITNFFWAFDSQSLFYLQDAGGDEDWHLYSVAIQTKKVDCLTPFKGVKVGVLTFMKQFPTKMLLEMNKRDPKVNDVYMFDLVNKEMSLLAQNNGSIDTWIPDRKLSVRGALESTFDGGHILLVRDTETSVWRKIRSWNAEDSAGLGVIEFTADGQSLVLSDAQGCNTSRLIHLNLQSGAIETIFEDPHYDAVAGLFVDSETFQIKAIETERDRSSWTVLDPSMKEHFSAIAALDSGDFSFTSHDSAQELFTVAFSKDNGPVSHWLYNKTTRTGRFLFDNKPALNDYTLAPMHPFTCTARDGLVLHGYITYPVYGKKKDLPLVLCVHGGPWARDSWGYNQTVQWLANRGYVVLQVNFRGSTGYGKAFLNAGNKQWSRAMQTDLLDALNWAIAQGRVNPKKVGIFGGSYGGYAALVGAAFTPDVFACAVDLVGPSNLITLLETIPPYWSTGLAQFYTRVGHPVDDRQFLLDCSPLTRVDAIKIPLLIAQGANDPRVKQSESEQIVAALKAKNIQHTYMLFPDEGHGFVKPHNRIAFYTEVEKFFAEHLGGRVE